MKKLALCIGINDYPGTGSDLAGCVNDARDWKAALEKHGFKVALLLDRKATGAAIRKGIKTLVAMGERGDCLVVQYSGHGSFVPDLDGDEPDGTDECLCPYDVRTKGPITDDELCDLYGESKPGVKILMISDSCHSGTVSKFAPIMTPPTVRGRGAPQRKVRFLPPGAFLSKRAQSKLGVQRARRASSPPGRNASLLLAGCQDTEYSYDAYFQGRSNGAFTFVALQALKKLKKNAAYRDWYVAIRKILPSQQYPQTPNLYGTKRQKKWKVFA